MKSARRFSTDLTDVVFSQIKVAGTQPAVRISVPKENKASVIPCESGGGPLRLALIMLFHAEKLIL